MLQRIIGAGIGALATYLLLVIVAGSANASLYVMPVVVGAIVTTAMAVGHRIAPRPAREEPSRREDLGRGRAPGRGADQGQLTRPTPEHGKTPGDCRAS